MSPVQKPWLLDIFPAECTFDKVDCSMASTSNEQRESNDMHALDPCLECYAGKAQGIRRAVTFVAMKRTQA